MQRSIDSLLQQLRENTTLKSVYTHPEFLEQEQTHIFKQGSGNCARVFCSYKEAL